jgi:hypothetical protein
LWLNFDLQLTKTDSDLLGFKPQITKNLFFRKLIEVVKYDSPNIIHIRSMMMRPVVAFIRSRPTVLYAILLKMGGLLGILRLASILLYAIHLKMFTRTMQKLYDGSDS